MSSLTHKQRDGAAPTAEELRIPASAQQPTREEVAAALREYAREGLFTTRRSLDLILAAALAWATGGEAQARGEQ